MQEPRVVEIPESVYRIGRSNNPLNFSRIRAEDASLTQAGNRFDVPGAGVLYAATDPIACFGETLSRFRPTPALKELLKGDTENFVVVGGVPQDWRLQRTIVRLKVDAPPQFLDVDAPETHEYLTNALSSVLPSIGYDAPLDISDIRGRNRVLSRMIALHAFTAQNDQDEFLYAGIKYSSRLSDKWPCWAIFEGSEITLTGSASIELDNEDLNAIAKLWDLRIF